MASVQFQIFGVEEGGGPPLRKINVECDFLPRVGDVFNTYNLFDELEVDSERTGNHFSIVFEIDWDIESGRAVPIVKLNRYEGKLDDRVDLLQRRGWLPRRK